MSDQGQETVKRLMAERDPRKIEEHIAERAPILREHLKNYIESDGAVGYIRDMTSSGGSETMLHLVLRTIGRKSGRVMLVPLTYAAWGDEYVIVASKGGAEQHPSWYLNLIARPEVEWQVRDKRFSGTWRIAEGEERQTLWDYVSVYYKGYAVYQSRTERQLPIIVLTQTGRIQERWEVPENPLAGLG